MIGRLARTRRFLVFPALLGLAGVAAVAARVPIASRPPLSCTVQLGEPESDGPPLWSPDGTQLAFLRFVVGGRSRIVAANTDGSAPRVVVDDVDGYHFSWSPQGRIAFARDSGIWAVPARGGDAAPLIVDASAGGPAYSPDGRRLAFTSGGSIWVASADGSGARALVGVEKMSPPLRWSPDGRSIAFTSFAGDPHGLSQVYAVDADGSNVRSLVRHPSGINDPAWAHDGSRLAFSSEGRLWVADLRTGVQRALTPAPTRPWSTQAHSPAWSPGGDEIAYIAHRGTQLDPIVFPFEIRVRRVTGGRERRVTWHCARGTGEGELLHATGFDDVVYGGAGDDRLVGEAGNDRLHGGPGRDVMLGGPGADTVLAQDGEPDRIACGRGRDLAAVDRGDVVARDCERVRRR